MGRRGAGARNEHKDGTRRVGVAKFVLTPSPLAGVNLLYGVLARRTTMNFSRLLQTRETCF